VVGSAGRDVMPCSRVGKFCLEVDLLALGVGFAIEGMYYSIGL
jgi:hypothetical protein